MNIVMFGPPGIGKGTQSEILSASLGIPKISTGDIMRENMERKTPIGLKIQETVNSGNLVSDETVIEIFQDRISQKDCAKGFITDGFPRTLKQAEALDTICSIDHVFNLHAPHDVLMKRITGRRYCPKCGANYNALIDLFKPKKTGVCDKCGSALAERADQEPKIVEQRLKVYEKQTKPIISYYKKQHKLHDIDSDDTPKNVNEKILKMIKKEK